MNITVIQFRTDASGPHEVKCIYDTCGLQYSQLSFLNVLSSTFDWRKIAKDTIDTTWIIGGWGEAGYESTDALGKKKLAIARKKLIPLIRHIVANGQPLIGICFGFQIMTDALGGRLEVNKSMAEGGLLKVNLTKQGRNDVIFSQLQAPFKAVLGHKTSVVSLPDGAIRLAYSDKCPIQAARFNDITYGFTFHPELTHEGLIERTRLYSDYVAEPENIKPEKIKTGVILRSALEQFAHQRVVRQVANGFEKKSI